MKTGLIAIGVGYEFCLINKEETKHIRLKDNGALVKIDGKEYKIHHALTYEESRSVDVILDRNKVYKINDYKIDN